MSDKPQSANWFDLVAGYLSDLLAAHQQTNKHLHALRASLDKQVTLMSQMDDEITTLKDDVAAERTAVDSAKALIEGFASQLAAAVQTAQDAGATTQQLQDLNDLHAAVTQQTQDLASAVASQAPVSGGTP